MTMMMRPQSFPNKNEANPQARRALAIIPTNTRIELNDQLIEELQSYHNNIRGNTIALAEKAYAIRCQYRSADGDYTPEFMTWWKANNLTARFGLLPNFSKYAAAGEALATATFEKYSDRMPTSMTALYEVAQLTDKEITLCLEDTYTRASKDDPPKGSRGFRKCGFRPAKPLLTPDVTAAEIRGWRERWRFPMKPVEKRKMPFAAVKIDKEKATDFNLYQLHNALVAAMKPFEQFALLETKLLDKPITKIISKQEAEKAERQLAAEQAREAERKAAEWEAGAPERKKQAERRAAEWEAGAPERARRAAEEEAERVRRRAEEDKREAEAEAAWRKEHPAAEFGLSKQTRKYLKNFSSINNSIIFRPGKALAVVGKDKDSIARATITDNIPYRFAINDVSKFLKTLNLYGDDATILLNRKTLTIKNGEAGQSHFTLGAEKGIATTEKSETTIPPVLTNFRLTADALASIKKNISRAGLNTVVFYSNGKTLGVKALNIGDQTSNEYDGRLGTHDKKFSIAFSDTKIKMMLDANYDVAVTDKIVRFRAGNLEYLSAPLKKTAEADTEQQDAKQTYLRCMALLAGSQQS